MPGCDVRMHHRRCWDVCLTAARVHSARLPRTITAVRRRYSAQSRVNDSLISGA